MNTHADLAASAVIEVVLLSGATLRFGGHPSISRLVLDIGSRLHRGPQVELFQSLYFERDFTSEAKELVASQGATLAETPRIQGTDDGTSMKRSLAVMREQMLTGDRLDAAFMIGGRGGLAEELRLIRESQPDVQVFLFDQPGGEARELARQFGDHAPNVRVLDRRDYREQVVESLASFMPGW